MKSSLIHFFILIWIVTESSGKECKVLNYTTDNGLPYNYVNSLIFDRFNNLWIGTQGGLFLFDGLSFHTIHHNKLNPRILFLQKDVNNEVYIIDSEYHIFKQNLKFNPLNIIKVDYQNVKSNFDVQFPLFSRENYTFSIFNNYHPNLQYHLALKEQNALVGNKDRLNNVYEKFHKELLGTLNVDKSIIILFKNNAWKVIRKNGQLENIKANLPMDCFSKGLFFQSDINTFLLYRKVIYKVTFSGELLSIKPVITNIPLDKVDDNLVIGSYNSLYNMFAFGSEKNGLFLVFSPYFYNLTYNGEKTSKFYSLFGNAYYSQAEFSPNDILINNYLKIKGDRFGEYLTNNLPYNRAFNYKDSLGRVWYNNKDTLTIIGKNYSKKIVLKFPSENGFNFQLLSMTQTNDSTYYIISPTHSFRINAGLNSLIKSPICKSNHLHIPMNERCGYIYYNQEIRKIYLLTNKNIYICNDTLGDCKVVDKFNNADFRIIQPISKKHYFLGTYGQGYFLFDGKKLISMPLDPKGYLKFAHAALTDDQGHAWISSNNGLFRTRLIDLEDFFSGKSKSVFYYYYNKSSGFATNEFNGGCQSPAIELHDGRFSFSSMDGLVQFNPLMVPTQFPKEPIHILQIMINGKMLDTIPQALTLSQDDDDIRFEISTPFYGHPDNFIIEYRISKIGKEWKQLNQNRYISLQNLPHESYTLEIRKRIGFGSGNFDYLRYNIVVLPKFYQTWWFISLLFVLGVLLTYTFSRWYNRYTIQKNKELEMLIAEKNAGLIEINKALKEKIKQNDLFQSVLVHDIKSPLRFIVSTTKLLLNFWPSVSEEIKKENITHIHESASKIGSFVKETLLWIQIRNGEHNPNLINFSIQDLLIENINLYSEDPKIILGSLVIHVDCPSSLYLQSDPSLISTIIRNLLANSIKFSEFGNITLYAYEDINGKIVIGCKDEGKGLSDTMAGAILANDYKGNSIRKDSFRMGFVIIKEILRLLGGKLGIKSTNELGSDIYVVLNK